MASEPLFVFVNQPAPESTIGRDTPEIIFYATLLVALVALAFFARHRGAKWFGMVERALARLALHRARAVLTVGLISLALIMTLSAFAGIPWPKVDDEFSYLLAADTFSHGRLANPPHPLWTHFETFHVIQQPTYASRYPPGQGLVLALGQLLGHPAIGVWLSTAFACGALCWMLMGWMRARWAVIGAFFACVHPEILAWSQRYWGGSMLLAGAALALGGFRRLLDMRATSQMRNAVVMAIGMAIMIVCRPYEGGVMTLILLVALAIGLINQKPIALSTIVRIGSSVAAILIATALWMGYFNWRVTHNFWRMPHQVYIDTYNAAPVFLWQKQPPTPVYHHDRMRAFHTGWELRPYLKQRTFGGLLTGLLERTAKLIRSDLRLWPLLLACPALPWALKDRWMQIALLMWIVFTAALLQVTWTFFHYAAPAFGLFLVVATQSWRHLRLWRWHGRPVGLFLARGCVILSLLSPPYTLWRIAQLNNSVYARRFQIVKRLRRDGGNHLIIVRYAKDATNTGEWVYNKADIDHSPVIWARETSPAENRELLDYFKDRHVWLLQVGAKETRLVPYSDAQDSNPT